MKRENIDLAVDLDERMRSIEEDIYTLESSKGFSSYVKISLTKEGGTTADINSSYIDFEEMKKTALINLRIELEVLTKELNKLD